MKHLFIALAIMFFFGADVSAQGVAKSPKWESLIGYKSKSGATAFWDSANRQEIENNGEQYTIIPILSVNKNIENIVVNNKNLSVGSVVRVMMVHCKTGSALKIIDLYFETKTPTTGSVPLLRFEYEPIESNVLFFSADSVIYSTVCGPRA